MKFLAIIGIISYIYFMTHETETHDETPLPTIADLRKALLLQAKELDQTFQYTIGKAQNYSRDYYAPALKSQVQFRQCLEYLLKVKALQKKSSKPTNELLKDPGKGSE
jgi:hypothetical protein